MLGLVWGHRGVVNVGSCSLRARAVSSYECQSRDLLEVAFRCFVSEVRKKRLELPVDPRGLCLHTKGATGNCVSGMVCKRLAFAVGAARGAAE